MTDLIEVQLQQLPSGSSPCVGHREQKLLPQAPDSFAEIRSVELAGAVFSKPVTS